MIIWICENTLFSGNNLFQVSHPPHLTSNSGSALIPFCAFKTDMTMSKQPHFLPGISFALCSSFLPTMLEGQLCYKLNLNMTRSEEGKDNQLLLVLDNNEDRSLQTSSSQVEEKLAKDDLSGLTMNLGIPNKRAGIAVKTKIGILSQNNHFGDGKCKMTVVKRMSAKADFLKMPLGDRKCTDELYEDCRTRKLLKKCNCVPWEVPGYQVAKHKYKYLILTPSCGRP